MEIYRNADEYVFIEVPAAIISAVTSVDVRALGDDGKFLYEFTIAEPVLTGVTGYRTPVPWHLSRSESDFTVEWTIRYTEYGIEHALVDEVHIEVVSPILPMEEIARISGWTDPDDIKDLERRVRHAIQTYTGQNFGKFYDRITVTGTGSQKLSLPAPLLRLATGSMNVAVVSNGWALSLATNRSYTIKDAPPDAFLNAYGHMNHMDIVLSSNAVFHDGREYHIEGLWGYRDIPADVKQAARMLVTDYSCDESLWRDRYIDSVRSGNWRFELNEKAFVGTGNVAVDQILEEYRQFTLAVV